jgi:hypothetical protein
VQLQQLLEGGAVAASRGVDEAGVIDAVPPDQLASPT